MIYKRRKAETNRGLGDDDPIKDVAPRWLHLLGCKRDGCCIQPQHPKMVAAMGK